MAVVVTLQVQRKVGLEDTKFEIVNRKVNDVHSNSSQWLPLPASASPSPKLCFPGAGTLQRLVADFRYSR